MMDTMAETKRCKAYLFVCTYCHRLLFVDNNIYDGYAYDGDYRFLGIFKFETAFLDKLTTREKGVWDETREG